MSCDRCKKRSLTHIANDVFRDPRVAKKWLHNVNTADLDNKKPIDLIALDGADHHKIVKTLYIAALKDYDLLNRETVEQRNMRFTKTVQLIFNMNQQGAHHWISKNKILLKNPIDAAILQNQLIQKFKL